MNILIITTKESHMPKIGNENGFTVIDTNGDRMIWRRQMGDYILFVTNCIDDETLPQAKKHAIILDLIRTVRECMEGQVVENEYLILHDADLLKYNKKELGNPGFVKNGIYYEEQLKASGSPLVEVIKDGHIYIFQHKRAKPMFSGFIHNLNLTSFSIDHIEFALSLFNQ